MKYQKKTETDLFEHENTSKPLLKMATDKSGL